MYRAMCFLWVSLYFERSGASGCRASFQRSTRREYNRECNKNESNEKMCICLVSLLEEMSSAIEPNPLECNQHRMHLLTTAS